MQAHRTLQPVALVVLALAAFCAVLPLLTNGISCGHDFDFHLFNWLETASQWRHGIVRPVWDFSGAWYAGEPRLLMYPPLSWLTGGFLTALLPWAAVPVTFLWLVLFLCGMTMRRLLRRWCGPGVALLGGCLYLVNPYMLFCAYERAAYAELMAAAWMPLLLAAMLRPRLSVGRIAIAVALLWLTNAPAAVIGCYTILLLGIARLLWSRREGTQRLWRIATTVAAGVVLGLLLDAHYLLPMAAERPYMQLTRALLPRMQPDANYLFAHSDDAFHDHVTLHSSIIGLVSVGIAVVSGTVWLLLHRRERVHTFASMHARQVADDESLHLRRIVFALLAYSLVILFLQLPMSALIWHTAPELNFLQFPWRFISMESAVAIALLLLLLQQLLPRTQAATSKNTLAFGMAGVVLALTAAYTMANLPFREECDDEEGFQTQREDFFSGAGSAPTDEYTPTDADDDALKMHLPPAWLAHEENDDAKEGSAVQPAPHKSPGDETFRFNAPAVHSYLVVHVREFPGWHTLLDDVEIKPEQRDDGLIAVPLPADGIHTVRVFYKRRADQWAGYGVTALVLIGWASVSRRRRSGIMKTTA